MKLIIGADGRAGDVRVGNLVRRLAFGETEGKDSTADVVSVIETIPYLWMSAPETSSPELIRELMDRQEEGAIAAANAMTERLKGCLLVARSFTRQGSAVSELLFHANDVHADLIAVGGAQETEFGAFLTGSVGRGLVMEAKQNLLVAKSLIADEGPLRVVLATDHSHYANRCLDTLLQLNPRGIRHLSVLTAYPKENIQAMRPLLPEAIDNPAEWVTSNLHERNARVIEKLKPLGCTFDSNVVTEFPNQAIERTMKEKNADLLIVGARGHGFIERLTLGSVSFRQVVAEPYSVLVLRAAKQPD